MRRSLFLSTLALLFTVLAGGLFASDNWYAVTYLKNGATFDVNFRYRFGQRDEWHQIKLVPGHYERFHYKYSHANEDKSPGVQILVDVDTTHSINRQEFQLVAHACPDIEGTCGTHYKFLVDASKHKLEVVREN